VILAVLMRKAKLTRVREKTGGDDETRTRDLCRDMPGERFYNDFAPKAGVISLGSPSFSISILKTIELEKYLVVAWCTKM
jgi:hypothetical protein